MKRLLPLLLAFTVLFTLGAMPVYAAEADMQVLYLQTPEDWENPCVWAWDEDGTGAFDAWPGGSAEQDAANPGWWYIYLPAWANNVIINANGGEVQTEDMQLEGPAWVTVEEDGSFEVSYEAQTTGEAPAYVERFTLYAQVPAEWDSPSLWAWLDPDGTNAFAAWPGEAMAEGEDGWYSVTAPTWINSIILNANEGEVQTEDIEIEPQTLWITVAEDGSYELSYEDPNAPEATGTVRVQVMAPADWDTPNLWAWTHPDGTNVFAAWPGEPLQAGEDGWLYYDVPDWVNSLIVNANEGAVQTEDIRVDEGKDIWVVVTDADNVEAYYEQPTVPAEAPAEEQPAESLPDESEAAPAQAKDGGNTVLYIIIAVAALAVVAVILVVVVRKRRK